MGMFGSANPFAGSTLPQQPFAPDASGMPALSATAPKPGFFSRNGMGVNILGGIGDALAVAGGARPTFLPMVMQQRQRQQELADQDRRQQAQMQQWVAQQEWERAHPKPINNDTVNDYNFRVRTLGQEAANQWLRSQGDPIVTIPLGENRIYSGPRSGIGAAVQGSVASQRPAIGAVVADPRKGGSGSGQSGFRP